MKSLYFTEQEKHMKAFPLQPSRAWTGGKSPAGYSAMTTDERRLVRCYFRGQIDGSCGCGRRWFFETPFGVMDYARILWNRAKYDAWASLDKN